MDECDIPWFESELILQTSYTTVTWEKMNRLSIVSLMRIIPWDVALMEDSKPSLAMGGTLDRLLGSIRESICDGYSTFIEAIRGFVKRSPKETLATTP